MEKRRVPLDRRIPSIVCILVMTVWTISFVATLVIPDYNPPVEIHALMMAVAGATLAAWQRKPPNSNGNGRNRERYYNERNGGPYDDRRETRDLD